MENPKKASNLFKRSLEFAPACTAIGTKVQDKLELATSSGGNGDNGEIASLLDGMRNFFEARDNCDEKFLFAYHKQTVASIYVGMGLGKHTVNSALETLAARLRANGSVSSRTIAQLCGSGRLPERVFGISIDTTGDLTAVQRTALEWSKGKCAIEGYLTSEGHLPGVEVFDIAGTNRTLSRNGTYFSAPSGSRRMNKNNLFEKRATCRHIEVEYGDYCDLLASRCGISVSDFYQYNPKSDLCWTLMPGDYVCCSSGEPYKVPQPEESPPSQEASQPGASQSSPEGTCRHVQVNDGDYCDLLASRCGISVSDFYQYNPKSDLCWTLMPGDYVCCSPGEPYTASKSEAPKSNPDGTCAIYLIQNGDSCYDLAMRYGVTIQDLENWNRGKTWGWSDCAGMLFGYNMCVSEGSSPLPPPQEGTECGPLVPGTQPPTDRSVSLADLNPCPLKVCCSNWGYCGVFPAHCDIHAPEGGGPGSRERGYQNTCVSNCGMEIKQNSGPPAVFQRIGYYEAFNFERECLWLKAKNANTDGSYTHIHWAFAEIDPNTWKPVIKDRKQQWDDFKALPNVKRIVAFGGWAYSTEPATYTIIRSAIINNWDIFTSNLAKFAEDEGIDGVDIDWEYPGAPDILVNGQPIGQKGDGIHYLEFLTALRSKLGSNKSLSIAAPASYWYLKAFPIDRIAEVVDYIVYMTYDLHGQWDYGNVNAFDQCPSGKCIRSHVNLTETRNTLAIITKAGVPNNKIFVGEASYGRSFHMAEDGCWEPMCEFTGSRIQSDANPGRCTKTGGYIALAEIDEVIKRGDGTLTFRDDDSDTDILLYKGDYVAYMSRETKDRRRTEWKGLNFGGSIDWAVDLQSFSAEDMEFLPDRPKSGEGCVSGEDNTVDSEDLCEFSCSYGFCPESLCTCVTRGPLRDLPAEKPGTNVTAWDEFDVDLNRLCKFACKYGYCPGDVCTTVSTDSNDDNVSTDSNDDASDNSDYLYTTKIKSENNRGCAYYRDTSHRDMGTNMCKSQCQAEIDKAADEGRTVNYGCVAFFPLDKEIPWTKICGECPEYVRGECICNNLLVNEIANTVLEAMPIIAQIGCYVLMSSLKLVLDVGAQLIPGPGKALDAGLDMATTAAQMAAYLYPEEEDPEGAFSWWLSPCGGTNLVPDDIKRVFEILRQVPDGVSSFKAPKNIRKGSGKKGDDGNPIGQSTHRAPRPPDKGSGRPADRKKCRIPPSKETKRGGAGKNTLRMLSCVNDKTHTEELVITSLTYAANAKPTQVTTHCKAAWTQACYHYSSAIRVSPQWATLTCPPEAAKPAYREPGPAPTDWTAQHKYEWRGGPDCDRDEFPPAYFLSERDPACHFSGGRGGQLMRLLPDRQNRAAGWMWRGVCFQRVLKGLSDRALRDLVERAPRSNKRIITKDRLEVTMAGITVDSRPEFCISSWGQSANPPQNDGLEDNPCWPRDIAADDPGFALLESDPYYNNKDRPYDYRKPYEKGKNGS